MQAGDLVQLSSAGWKTQQNDDVKVKGAYGIILEITGNKHPYQIQWFGTGRDHPHMFPMARHEIKYYKG